MRMPKKTILVLFLAAIVMIACSSYEDIEKNRAKRAQAATGNIRIAMVWQEKLFNSYFYEGAELAADEINQNGGIKGRKIQTIRYNNESGTKEMDMKLVKKIAADPYLVAVIGHYDWQIGASVTYEYSGILFMAAAGSIPGLTQHDFQYVFRNIPSDRETGMDLANFVKKIGFSDVLIIDDRTASGKGLADIFHERASKIGINVIARKSYSIREEDFKPLLGEIKKQNFDAIFLGGGIPEAGILIKQAREMGVVAPFIGGAYLNSTTIWNIAGNAAEGMITSTSFHHDDHYSAAQIFTRKFYARFYVYPDAWAAHGYDSIKLIATAIEKAGSTVPLVVASYLRYIENFEGTIGTYSFTLEGDIVGEINDFQVLHNGRFELIEGNYERNLQRFSGTP